MQQFKIDKKIPAGRMQQSQHTNRTPTLIGPFCLRGCRCANEQFAMRHMVSGVFFWTDNFINTLFNELQRQL